MAAGARCSGSREFESDWAGAQDPLLFGFDDLVDCWHATATGFSGRAGVHDIVAIACAVAKRFADRAIGDALALADDHRLHPIRKRIIQVGALFESIERIILKMKFNIIFVVGAIGPGFTRISKNILFIHFTKLSR